MSIFKKAQDVHYQPQKFATLKTFLAVIAGLLIIGQIIAIFQICGYLTQSYRNISREDFESLKMGELVKGIIDKSDVIMSYREEFDNKPASECLLVMTANHKLLVVAAGEDSTDSYSRMMDMINGRVSYFEFAGKVIGLPSSSYQTAQVFMVMNNVNYSYELNNSAFLGQAIGAVDVDRSYAVSALMATIAGIVVMLVLIYFLMRKTINNIRYGILVQKGIIEPELKVRKEDLVLENAGTYVGSDNDAESFYVNTDYDLQTNGGILPDSQSASNSNSGDGSYHFTSGGGQMPSADSNEPDTPEPMRFLEEVEFYQSGVNEEGNFYVDQGEEHPEDDSTRHYKKY